MRFELCYFTHQRSFYSENQDCLLVDGQVVQSKTAFFSYGTLNICDKNLTRVAVSDGAGGLPSAAHASRAFCQNLANLDARGLRLPPTEMAAELRYLLSAEVRKNKAALDGGVTLITAELYKKSLANAVDNLLVLSPYSEAPRPTSCLQNVLREHTLLHCSDGVFESLSNYVLLDLLASDDLEVALNNLMQAALGFHKTDNMSLIALKRID